MKQLSKTYCFLITINNIRLISMLLILALSVLIKLSQVFMFKGDNHIIIYLFNNEAKLTIVFKLSNLIINITKSPCPPRTLRLKKHGEYGRKTTKSTGDTEFL